MFVAVGTAEAVVGQGLGRTDWSLLRVRISGSLKTLGRGFLDLLAETSTGTAVGVDKMSCIARVSVALVVV